MIDTFSETIISAEKAAEHVSELCGRKRTRMTLLRWMNKGVDGVVLESIQIGREIFTSHEALNRFFNECRSQKQNQRSESIKNGFANADSERIEREAKELGI